MTIKQFNDYDTFNDYNTNKIIKEEIKIIENNKFKKIGSDIGMMVDVKNKQYGDSFFKSHNILKILYPNGVNPDQYQDMLAIIRIVDKLFRIANGSQGNESPGRDIAGYGILMSYLHENITKNRIK